jgi:hypothetical protein
MQAAEIQSLFKEFLAQFDSVRQDEIWENQSQVFKSFWKDKILNPNTELTAADTDAIVRLLDTKARGHQKSDAAVAQTGVRQGVWGRLFDDLKNKKDIQRTMDEIFNETDDSTLANLILGLQEQNKNNKNGLTGKRANALNTLLFINNPTRFIASVSLSHRFQIMRAFGLGNPDEFKNYGEQIVLSNRRIIDGFKEKFGTAVSPRTLSEFFYANNFRRYWQQTDEVPKEPDVDASQEMREIEFAMETHLEDFLIRNWESTELGKKYELIEEDGEILSQQYQTEVGRIDLLVKDKVSKQFVIIELKKGQTSDDTVGQIARYMGWVKKRLANGKDVKGIIIAGVNDLRLQFALQTLLNVELFIYKVSFALQEAEQI